MPVARGSGYSSSKMTRLMPQLATMRLHCVHGCVVQYSSAPSMETPVVAAWMMAFCSACRHGQMSASMPCGICSSSRRQPTSMGCGKLRGAPL